MSWKWQKLVVVLPGEVNYRSITSILSCNRILFVYQLFSWILLSNRTTLRVKWVTLHFVTKRCAWTMLSIDWTCEKLQVTIISLFKIRWNKYYILIISAIRVQSSNPHCRCFIFTERVPDLPCNGCSDLCTMDACCEAISTV